MTDGTNQSASLAPLWSRALETETLRSYDVLYNDLGTEFDEIARAAAESCDAASATIALIDRDRLHFRAKFGFEQESVSVDARAAQTFLARDIIASDLSGPASKHSFVAMMLPEAKSYAGIVLTTPDGFPIGTLSVIDQVARDFTISQVTSLRFLAKQTMNLLEHRRTAFELRRELAAVKQDRLLMKKFEWLVTQAPGFIAIVDTQGYVTYLNGFAREAVGLKPDQSIPAGVEFLIEPDDHGTFQDDVMPLVRKDGEHQFKLRIREMSGGDPVRALFTMFALANEHGRKIGYGLWAENIEQQEADKEYEWTLKREAVHRLQNSLAVTASLVAQTLRTMTTPEEAISTIRGRLDALGHAVEVLKADVHPRADIADVVRLALAAHDPGGERIRLLGPSRQIEGKLVQGLSLALHELGTNATKYGALTTDQGKINITWRIGSNRSFQLEWSETGGPVVKEPIEKGFGSRLIGQTGRLFFGTAETEYRPEGLHFSLVGKLPQPE